MVLLKFRLPICMSEFTGLNAGKLKGRTRKCFVTSDVRSAVLC